MSQTLMKLTNMTAKQVGDELLIGCTLTIEDTGERFDLLINGPIKSKVTQFVNALRALEHQLCQIVGGDAVVPGVSDATPHGSLH
jgi:hypothetical protein